MSDPATNAANRKWTFSAMVNLAAQGRYTNLVTTKIAEPQDVYACMQKHNIAYGSVPKFEVWKGQQPSDTTFNKNNKNIYLRGVANHACTFGKQFQRTPSAKYVGMFLRNSSVWNADDSKDVLSVYAMMKFLSWYYGTVKNFSTDETFGAIAAELYMPNVHDTRYLGRVESDAKIYDILTGKASKAAKGISSNDIVAGIPEAEWFQLAKDIGGEVPDKPTDSFDGTLHCPTKFLRMLVLGYKIEVAREEFVEMAVTCLMAYAKKGAVTAKAINHVTTDIKNECDMTIVIDQSKITAVWDLGKHHTDEQSISYVLETLSLGIPEEILRIRHLVERCVFVGLTGFTTVARCFVQFPGIDYDLVRKHTGSDWENYHKIDTSSLNKWSGYAHGENKYRVTKYPTLFTFAVQMLAAHAGENHLTASQTYVTHNRRLHMDLMNMIQRYEPTSVLALTDDEITQATGNFTAIVNKMN